MGILGRLFSRNSEAGKPQPRDSTGGSAKAWCDSGRSKLTNGNAKGAIPDFTRAIEADPNDDYAYSARGFAYGMLEKHKLAIRDLTKAIELEPRGSLTYHWRAESRRHLRRGDLRERIDDYSKAIELDPGLAEAYLWRGWTYSLRGLALGIESDFRRALSDCEKFLELAPDHPNAAECREKMAVLKTKLGESTP
jgi:tetratricopeptide (TPR) repeat protein